MLQNKLQVFCCPFFRILILMKLLFNRVRTDFWIQNSTFPKTIVYFSRLKVTIGEQLRPWKTQQPSIFHDALQMYGNWNFLFCDWTSWLRARLNGIWPRGKTEFTLILSTFCSLEKKLQTFHYFPLFFLGLENCFANFKTFSGIQGSVRTLLLIIDCWANSSRTF